MTDLLQVRQDSLTSMADGNTPPQALLRMGIAPLANKWDLFALQGRMFNAFQGTLGTAVAGSLADNAGVLITVPCIRATVPTGITMFPRRFQIAMLAVATAIDNELIVAYSQTDSFTSATGGTAITPRNLRTDNPRASALTSFYITGAGALVEAALTNPRALYQQCWPLDMVFGTSYDSEINVDVKWNELHPIIGPASFLIYTGGKTASNTHYWNLEWAEIPTECAVD